MSANSTFYIDRLQKKVKFNLMVEWSWNFEFSSYYVVLEEQSDAQWNRKMGPIPRQEGEHDRPAQDENSDIEDAGQLFLSTNWWGEQS